MKMNFDLLTRKEKGILGVLGLLLVGALCIFLFIGVSQKRSFIRADAGIEDVERELKSTQAGRDAAAAEWESWQKSRQDYQTIKENYLYGVQDALPFMRADIQHILQKENLQVPQIHFEYEDFSDENIRLIRFSFTVRGSYSRLKSLVREIEALPQFLVLEKIDFVDIQTQTGVLSLRLHLLGYQSAK